MVPDDIRKRYSAHAAYRGDEMHASGESRAHARRNPQLVECAGRFEPQRHRVCRFRFLSFDIREEGHDAMIENLKRHPGWIVCRKLQQIPVPSIAVLPRWAECGRIRPDDYLVNPTLEVCFQIRELPELHAILRRMRTGPLDKIRRTLRSYAMALVEQRS
jgi:hypothetical protein